MFNQIKKMMYITYLILLDIFECLVYSFSDVNDHEGDHGREGGSQERGSITVATATLVLITIRAQKTTSLSRSEFTSTLVSFGTEAWVISLQIFMLITCHVDIIKQQEVFVSARCHLISSSSTKHD